MTQEEMLEVVSRNEDICSAMLGAMKALEYGVRILVATHPKPEVVKHAWHDLLRELPDHHLKTTAPNSQLFNVSMTAMLGRLTGQIDLAAQSYS